MRAACRDVSCSRPPRELWDRERPEPISGSVLRKAIFGVGNPTADTKEGHRLTFPLSKSAFFTALGLFSSLGFSQDTDRNIVLW